MDATQDTHNVAAEHAVGGYITAPQDKLLNGTSHTLRASVTFTEWAVLSSVHIFLNRKALNNGGAFS